MSDVACVCCAPLVAEVRARGLDPRQLVEGLPLTLAQLENPRRRIRWEPFREFARRAGELLGGAGELEEVAARAAPEAVPQLLRLMLPHLGSARPIYLIGARWWGPWVFRGTRATCESLADGRLREVIEILPDYGECPEFFQGLRGVLRAMPRLFGQPDAVVDLAQDGRRGEYVIAAPPPKRRSRWLRPARRSTVSPLPEDLEELGFRQEQLRDALQRARATATLLAERTRRLETVHRLGIELVWHRDTQSRAEGMVRLLRDRLPLRGIRLGYDGSETGGPPSFAESGETTGAPDISRSLQVAGRPVGRLELWTPGAASLSREDEVLLGDFLPWLALALDASRSDEQIHELRDELEEDLAQWHRAERRLEQLLGSPDRAPRSVALQEQLQLWSPRLARTAGSRVNLDVQSDPDLESVVVNPALLERLLVDVVKILRDAGSRAIQIRAHGGAADEEQPDLRTAVELELRGEGAPLAPKTQARLLEALAQGGVGASASAEVEATPEGEPRLRLPLPVAERGGVEERVLLVEGDPARRATARRTLEAAGYHVVEAADLAEAMAICDDSAEPIELLMTDGSRPSFDLDGARRALEEHPGLRGVLLLRIQRP